MRDAGGTATHRSSRLVVGVGRGEPGAGSDFAGLGSRAVRDGDEWVVNGQKVWNTLAHLGDWGMLVCPHRSRSAHHRIGDVGEGWRVALTTLMNERSAIGSGGGGARRRGPIDVAIQIWKDLPADRRSRRQEGHPHEAVLLGRGPAVHERAGRPTSQGGQPCPEMSIAKLAMAEFNKSVTEFSIDLLGADGLVGFDYTFRRPDSLSVDGMEEGIRHSFLRARANSIEGGTSEIMRNILGEQVLGLPGEPRVDKDLPWSKVPRS